MSVRSFLLGLILGGLIGGAFVSHLAAAKVEKHAREAAVRCGAK